MNSMFVFHLYLVKIIILNIKTIVLLLPRNVKILVQMPWIWIITKIIEHTPKFVYISLLGKLWTLNFNMIIPNE